LDPTYRVPGNASFADALQKVVDELEAAGFLQEPKGPGRDLSYRIERREMGGPAWDPLSASLTLVGQDTPLMTLTTNINLLAANSFSTPEGGVEAELVDVGAATAQDFQGVDVRGKIVLGDGSTSQLFRRAVVEGGALGVLAFRLPSFNRPEINRGVAAMSSVPYDPEIQAWGLALSLDARDALREAVGRGPTKVRVDIQSHLYPSEELTLVAEVRGTRFPEERLVFSAHVQESGANDNLSGVVALAEVARALGEGVRSGAFSPSRTITMIWGDEITSTRRYLEDDPARAEKVKWGISLDMVGEDTDKTGGTFLIEKMPDPSAVWTRGDDRHTEWGGRPLTLDQMTPHYLNDFVLNRCREEASGSQWVVGTNPFEGGSDHVPFLRAGIPGILLWHFTDQFYHTDGDRLEMVSASTLKHVAACAAVSAMVLTTADDETAGFLARELEEAAVRRIRTELALGKAALASGEDLEEQKLILSSWTDWYVEAVGTLEDLRVGGVSASLAAVLDSVQLAVAQEGERALSDLAGR